MSEELDRLLVERRAIQEKSAPFRARRDSLIAEFQPLEAELRDAKLAIEAIETPRLRELNRMIAALEAIGAIAGQRGVSDCCKQVENLVVREERKVAGAGGSEADLVIRVCKVCSRRHFMMSADAGAYGLTGRPTGG